MAESPVELKVGRFTRAYLFMSLTTGRKGASNLIIAAHGALPEGSKAATLLGENKNLYNEDAMAVYAVGVPSGRRNFYFYGPVGKMVTFPPIGNIIRGDKHTVPFEIRSNNQVEDYILTKYLNTTNIKMKQNKLEMSYGTVQMDLNDDDPDGNWHVFSVANRTRLVGNSLFLSQAVELAEAWNERRYDRIYCCFCRGVYGAARRVDQADQHTYLDNRRGRELRT